MRWLTFWKRDKDPAPQEATRQPEPAPGAKKRLPKPRAPAAPLDAGAQAKLAQLRTRRELVAFDLERAEAAHRPDNPWRERMDLLAESLATVETDLATLDAEPRPPSYPLPATPIAGIEATAGNAAAVRFVIGNEAFLYSEETDWDQRGGPVVRGDLKQRAGDATRLVPPDTPPDRRDALAQHLIESVIVFATDLRDRALAGEPLPASLTLADLARPCPECGGWRDWRGHCDACATRAWRRQNLLAEAERLAKEREAEEEDRHRWADRLPIARRRLADLDREIAVLEGARSR